MKESQDLKSQLVIVTGFLALSFLFDSKVMAYVALILGLAPFAPEPHLLEKMRLLLRGELQRIVDIFDLLMHSAPVVLLLIKISVEGIPKS